jgi:hypothetical protein
MVIATIRMGKASFAFYWETTIMVYNRVAGAVRLTCAGDSSNFTGNGSSASGE